MLLVDTRKIGDGHRYSRPVHVMTVSEDWGQIARPRALQELICGTPDKRRNRLDSTR